MADLQRFSTKPCIHIKHHDEGLEPLKQLQKQKGRAVFRSQDDGIPMDPEGRKECQMKSTVLSPGFTSSRLKSPELR
jgi:hypothetical protein